MKISKPLKKLQTTQKISGNQKGVALVLVLTVMSLATIMILSFFSLATSENQASATYARGLQAQQVAEQAVNIVIAQIRAATADPDYGWASQPGAIRTWNKKGKDPFKGYKLYSDDTIVEYDEEAMYQSDFDEIKSWTTRPTDFVDLNEPVIRGEKVYFPIVDPLAKDAPEWPRQRGGEKDEAGVEGFDYNFDDNRGLKIPLGDADKIIREINSVGHLPLPVKWIYQLADGTLGTLSGGSFEALDKKAVTINKENQIVARFAFWADDESAKLNLNVHAGGLAWDTPRVGGDLDMDMGKYQPAQHEWQRYPGHPATTHLAPVLAPGVLDIVKNKNAMEMIFRTVPRIVGGGSESGTRKINPTDPKEQNGLIPDKDPLLPSVDEYVMRPDREPTYFPQADGRPAPVEDMAEMMERVRFFLTTSSRSPETTMFNTPKVCVWPVHNTDPGDKDYDEYHTVFDKLIRFCSQVGGKKGEKYEYIFKRENADSSTFDYEKIKRNRELYAYLDEYTDTNIPWIGRSFAQKYPSQERYQILTQIFDYIRSTNLHDDTLYQNEWEDAFYKENTSVHRTYTNPRRRAGVAGTTENQRAVHIGHGQVTPIRINYKTLETMGFGRFFTLKDVAIVVINCGEGPRPSAGLLELFGGVSTTETWPGYTVYGGGMQGVVQGRAYSNFPPMHYDLDELKSAADRGAAFKSRAALAPVLDNINDYPSWLSAWLDTYSLQIEPSNTWRNLHAARESNDEAKEKWAKITEFIYPAFNPSNWNFNLLYRNPDFPELDSNGDARPRSSWWAGNRNKVQRKAFLESHNLRLGPGERMLQACLAFDMFCPAQGWVPINPDMSVEIDMEHSDNSSSSFEFTSTLGRGKFMATHDFSGNKRSNSDLEDLRTWFADKHQGGWGVRPSGGVQPLNFFMRDRFSPVDPGFSQKEKFQQYSWVTTPFTQNGGPYIQMEGGIMTFRIKSGGEGNQDSRPQSDIEIVQEIEVKFPDIDNVPPPHLGGSEPGYINEFGGAERDPRPPSSLWALNREGANPLFNPGDYGADTPANFTVPVGSADTTGRLADVNKGNGRLLTTHDVVQSIGILHGDARIIAATPYIEAKDESELGPNEFGYFGPHYNYNNPKGVGYDPNDGSAVHARIAHDMSLSNGWRYFGASSRLDALLGGDVEDMMLVKDIDYNNRIPAGPIGDPQKYRRDKVQLYGDFDQGMGLAVDGPYINKPDEGNTHSLFNRTDNSDPNAWELRRDYGDFPYFSRDWIHEAGSPSYFSPNRITNGPGMFGSLPTGVIQNRPWQTLLFRPNAYSSAFGTMSHPGAEDPKDHYLLDLFWMPVVEPYAISEPLSTGGKVNLNYQILPFRHVKRNSALRGVFRSENMVLVPTVGDTEKARSIYTRNYKHNSGRGIGWHWRDKPNGGFLQGKRLRAVILEHETLKQFHAKFEDGEIFRSASEICDIHLLPQQIADRLGLTNPRNRLTTYTPFVQENSGKVPDMDSGKFWNDHAVIGDNSRERSYGNIYSRVTTKSNVFKVHYRAEVIKQGRRPGDVGYDKFDPEMDTVVGAYRGSSIVERYIDPDDHRIPDYAASGSIGSGLPSIGEFYRFRVLNPTRFAP